MSEMLVPKYIDVEIMMNDAIQMSNTRVLFGFEVENVFEGFDLMTSKELAGNKMNLKVSNQKEHSMSQLEIKSDEEKRIVLNHEGNSIDGYFEFTREMTANKYLNYENYQFEIKFDIIPKIYIKTKTNASHPTKISVGAKLLSNYQITHIKTENFKIASAFPICEQKGVNLTFSDFQEFDYNNTLRIAYTNNKLYSPFPALFIECQSHKKETPKFTEENDFEFKKPFPKTTMKVNKDSKKDKENLLINNLKYLLTLKIKEDLKKAKDNSEMRSTFKNKIVRFRNDEHPLSDLNEENLLKTYRY
jgi:hypothetical protein